MRHPSYIIQIARRLRQEATPEEKILWDNLRNRKLGRLKFFRQRPVGRYVVDFLCAELGLIVEVEGSVHRQPDQQAYDAQRFEELRLRGFRVMRVMNSDVRDHLDKVLAEILRYKELRRDQGGG